jgi:spore maturation protein CgeB
LLDVVRSEKPQVMFTIPFQDELDPGVITQISQESSTATIAWFCDDHWRFDSYTRRWAPCFRWSVTTSAAAVSKYHAIGYQNVIHSQWACNHFSYFPSTLPLKYDLTFVGQPHGDRRHWIDALGRCGIRTRVWGNGWESGRLTQEEMIEVFSTSRINLNLSNSSSNGEQPGNGFVRQLARAGARRVPSPVKNFVKGLRTANSSGLAVKDSSRQQIKGRNFEVPGCRGFMLTGEAEDLDMYYQRDQEIICFSSLQDLIQKIQYFLSHDDEREAVAQAGYHRTIQEHTYVHRFADIFRIAGFPVNDPLAVISNPPPPGSVTEVLM